MYVYIYIYISSLNLLIEINVINKVNSTFRIKMIVFPRYKIPRHYKFHHQRKNNLKEIRRKHP